ncbi:LysR family transcriptional regulator [Thermostaphylospora chromogena]|uniref:ModE molybdate transport repressor domain-containing protein n=1 Tax=Thermostaphylospora chromogena TaxID=35622 RepID=A0A1H1I0C3_9ACTN|nr:LysR family transcriptional regulator [Thermostaphylospora chromogena]SDR30798.1 ModE molybdate transport repressor domain-containing protein [Thermostaphylospora chromogena]
MDVQRLLIFREIARTGSIAGAARSLGWTQPAVSQHLRHLERQAGTPLVLRRPRGVQLTEAGQALLRHADAIATRVQAAVADLDALVQMRAGTVRLAVFPSAGATLAPAAMSLLARRHPGLEVRLCTAEPPQAVARLVSGEVDLAVTFAHAGEETPTPGELVRVPVGEDPLRLVLPLSHPCARPPDTPLDLRELAREKWIGGCERCTAHLRRACEAAGFAPDIRHSTDDYVLTQALIACDLAVGLLPRLALHAARDPGVAVRPVAGMRPRTLHILHHREADQIPAVRATVRALLDTAARVLTAS